MSKVYSTFISSVAAGLCIGLGGAVMLMLRGSFPGSNVVGAFLFSIGLFTVCTRGYALFTGRLCYPDEASLPELFVVWVGNFCGCFLMTALVHFASTGDVLRSSAAALVEGKMQSSYLGLFMCGIVCNICIFIAVDGYKRIQDAGRYLAIIFGVMVFILCGAEHCVADMFYWFVSETIYDAPLESIVCIVAISSGNMAGGVLLPMLERLR